MASVLNIRRLVWFGSEVRALHAATSCSSASWLPVSDISRCSSPRSPWAVRRRLNADPLAVVRYLDLEQNGRLSTRQSMRFGRKGSLSISLKESSHGKWYNFETGEFGDMLDLIAKTRRIDTGEALELATRDILTDNPEAWSSNTPGQAATAGGAQQIDRTAEWSQETVERILAESQPVEGSLAASYLASRGLTLSPLNTSHQLRFHPGLTTQEKTEGWLMKKVPAMVAVASHPASSRKNVQVTYLDPFTGRKHPRAAVARRTYGSFSDPTTDGQQQQLQHVCLLNDCPSADTSYISEGVETGLTVCQAVERSHVVATLGKTNFTKIDPAILRRKVVLVWDNDGQDVWNDDPVLRRTAAMLSAAGKAVSVVVPPLLPGCQKTDLNDILQSGGGRQAVEKVLRDCCVHPYPPHVL